MATTKTICSELYNKVYNAIIEAAENHGIEDEDDTRFGFYLEDGDWSIEGTASLPVEYIDDSFDHAFGTEVCGHLEHSFEEMPEIDEVSVFFGEDGEEVEFDFDKFYTQFDVTERKLRNGEVIKQGDEVLATNSASWRYKRYERAIFHHYNTETGEWFCKRIYHNGNTASYLSSFRGVITATEENISKFNVA